MSGIKLGLSLLISSMLATAALASAAEDPVPPPQNAAAAPAPAREAQIAFADKTIWNWQVVDDSTVLIQDRGRKWYKATLLGHCINISFVDKLGFESSPSGTFDKFSSIRVRGQRCPLVSLVETTAPPKKSKPKKPEPAAPTQLL